ncbi:AMP-binding protein [Iodobacter fluviatilis]|uniref:Acyl-coenzyme A synthetase/AMP-(Fatty) acid ligase n=1 Tax=Iodobacter fluviatilis TaxID=537 RepID=A0A377Q9F0_9NEIS|nr:AMP-binding protein [Iodobacter fluviatilis]TCU88601.1 acyl-coenzyme A synthetase/AMP-(fatty) acid ligase [Iodobacter fluviatilis]STQ91328.1 long-chain-fatty-acid--CoA ligase [Iodobacter fluviatilis]
MANFISLDRLLFTTRESTYPLAKNAAQIMDYGSFIKEVARWHHAFSLQSGHRFALYFNDSTTFAAALLGAWHAGKCVYLPSDILPATLQKLQESTDGFAGDVPTALSPISAANGSANNWQVLDLNAVMLVVYTSGSSGEPCAIPKKLSQLLSEVAALEACFGKQSAGATVLATVSHQHIYGLLFRILWPLSAGRVFDAERLVYPEDIAAALRDASPATTILVASPAHLKRLPEQLKWQTQSLRAVFSSGGPLPLEALPACRNLLGSAPFEIYGSSETGGIAWRQRQQDHQTAWRTLPGIAIRVENETLFLRSPHLSNNDWQASNDRVTLTPSGFELLGRSDRIIKIEEKRISLSAMEQALLATPLLDDVRLIVLPGQRLSLGLIASPSEAGWRLVDEQGKKALNQALRHALAESSEASALPRRFRYIWALPSNTQSKTTHAALLALFDPRRPEARLLERSKDAALLSIEVNASSPFFDGHFNTAPILPGVAQLEWALCLARELFELPAAFLRMEVLKFQQLIRPGSQIQLELKTLSKDTETMLTFKFLSTTGTHASGRIVLGNPA